MPLRPAFAEDVYGSARRSSSSEPRINDVVSTTRVFTSGASDFCASALAQRRSANLPKLRELCADGGGSNELNVSSTECPLASARASLIGELDFQYADSDSYRAELAEFYTYSEMDEFALNNECFIKFMRERKKELIWNELPHDEKCSIIQSLVGNLDNVDPEQRLLSVRVILYILQGAYGDFAELECKKQRLHSGNSDGKKQMRNQKHHRGSRRPSSLAMSRDGDHESRRREQQNEEDFQDEKSSSDSNSSKDDDDAEEEFGEERAAVRDLDLPSKWFGPDHGTGGYEAECLAQAAANAYLLYKQGLFQPLCSLLRLEITLPFERYADHSRQSSVSNSRSTSHMDLAAGGISSNFSMSEAGGGGGGGGSASGTFERRRHKRSATLADNERIRVVLNCLYHMIEALRRDELLIEVCAIFEGRQPPSPEHTIGSVSNFSVHHTSSSASTTTQQSMHQRLSLLRKQFLLELEEPLEHNKMSLVILLLDMMPPFVRAKNPHYPIKKVLLLCWKVLLATLGGIDALREQKAQKRRDAKLSPIEDTLEAAIRMKPVLQIGGAGVGGAIIGAGGGGGGLTSVMNSGRENKPLKMIKAQLAFKFKQKAHTARPFNRQIACSSAFYTGNNLGSQDNKFAADEGFSTDDGSQEDDNLSNISEESVGAAALDDFGDVNEAAIPSSDEEEEDEDGRNGEGEEGEQKEKNNYGSDLLDEILKELCSPEDDDSLSAQKSDGATVDDFGGVSEAAAIPSSEEEVKQQRWREESNNGGEREEVKQKEQTHEKEKDNSSSSSVVEGNGEGDQTPKACQSPVREDSPWPPPPPPGLPWRSKVREADIENFLQSARQKYFNYQLPNDVTTMFGLPQPVQNSIGFMKRNLFIPLSQNQLKTEQLYNKYPFSQREFIEDTPIERLYARILPDMAEYVIALLKVILASLASSKAKNDAVTILSDVLTPETDTNEVLSNSISLDLAHFGTGNVLEDNIRVAIDINRHKELVIKGASSILILLLKHLRLNHIYQFENFAQYLMLANCMPLVLKFLDQNMCRYFQSKHELVPFNYPHCALYMVRNENERPPLTAENVDEQEADIIIGYPRWRNVFSAINLLRVINKLVKGKPARTMMLVVYKSAPVLKRCMKAKLGIFQLYILKLLKLQARYLGRQWRKTNMDLISAIYMRVRHRLNDDWAFANETMRTKSFDFHREENELSLAIKRFNTRRYPHLMGGGAKAGPNAGAAVDSSSVPADNHHVVSTVPPTNGQQGGGAAGGEKSSATSTDATCSSSANKNTDELANEWDPKVWEPLDNSLQSILAWEPEFSERFLQNYEQWLDQEVYGKQIDWDALLQKSRGLLDIYC